MTWVSNQCRDACTPNCRGWIALWQHWIVLPSQGQERFQSNFQMDDQAPNLCDLWIFPKDCLICLTRTQCGCTETTWQRTLFWTRSTVLLRGVEPPSERTLGGVSTGSYPGRRSSWTLAYTMILSTQPVFSSRQDVSTRGCATMFGRSPNGLGRCVLTLIIPKNGSLGWRMECASTLPAKKPNTLPGWPSQSRCRFPGGQCELDEQSFRYHDYHPWRQ